MTIRKVRQEIAGARAGDKRLSVAEARTIVTASEDGKIAADLAATALGDHRSIRRAADLQRRL